MLDNGEFDVLSDGVAYTVCPYCGEKSKAYDVEADKGWRRNIRAWLGRHMRKSHRGGIIEASKEIEESIADPISETDSEGKGGTDVMADESETFEDDKEVPRRERVRYQRPPQERGERPRTLEEEMEAEMLSVLSGMLRKVPGARNQGWIVDCFKSDPNLRTDPRDLWDFIRRQCPNMDDRDLNTLISSVFAVRDKYMRTQEQSYPPFHTRESFAPPPSPPSGYGDRRFAERPHTLVGERLRRAEERPYGYGVGRNERLHPSDDRLTPEEIKRMMWELIAEKEKRDRLSQIEEENARLRRDLEMQLAKQREDMLSIINEFSQKISEYVRPPDDVVTRQDLQATLQSSLKERELEYLKRELELKDAQFKRTLEELRRDREKLSELAEKGGRATVDSYKSDETRLVADALNKVGELGQSVVTEHQKTRRVLVNVLSAAVGEGGESREKVVKELEESEAMPRLSKFLPSDNVDER